MPLIRSRVWKSFRRCYTADSAACRTSGKHWIMSDFFARTLTVARALFSDKVFDEQFYVTGDHVHSYADYAAAKLPKTSPRDGTETKRQDR